MILLVVESLFFHYISIYTIPPGNPLQRSSLNLLNRNYILPSSAKQSFKTKNATNLSGIAEQRWLVDIRRRQQRPNIVAVLNNKNCMQKRFAEDNTKCRERDRLVVQCNQNGYSFWVRWFQNTVLCFVSFKNISLLLSHIITFRL